MIRDSFVFYRSFYESIKDLPRDIQGEVYTAIMEYGLNGITTENLKPVSRSIFTLIKPVLDFSNKQYSNGLRGGRPKKTENPNETQMKPNKNPNETQTKPYKDVDVDVDVDVDKDVDSDIINQSEIGLFGFNETQTPKNADYSDLVTYFNKETKGVFGFVRLPLGEKRIANIKARLREHGEEAFREMVDKAAKSDFLKGGNMRSWTASFDWLIKPSNFEKVLSGNYDNRISSDYKGDATIGTEFQRKM